MAAEAFLADVNGNLVGGLAAALVEGNSHASRFPNLTEAKAFLQKWQVVAQKPNSGTGFSATIFKNQETGDFVISIRSTEFIDDAVRDSESTNKDIKDTGWGFGQIDDMRNWYESIKSQITGPLSVTGYSLGGHLATAFNLLYPGVASKVVTFNGAGVGTVQGLPTLVGQQALLGQMMDRFHALRTNESNAARELMQSAIGRDTYDSLKNKIETARIVGQLTSDMLSKMILELPYQILNVSDGFLLYDALSRIKRLVSESERIATYTSGDGSKPKKVQQSITDSESLDYQLAVLATSKQYNTSSLGVITGATNVFFGKTVPAGGGLNNQYDLVGMEMDGAIAASMVAHSQYHYGADQNVFIEDQPGVRGNALAAALSETLAYSSAKLLVNNYSENDFGDTHSLVLIIDSLKVQDVFQKLDPSATQGVLNSILVAASNLKASSNGKEGKAEGDVLENMLNSLGDFLLGGRDKNTKRLKGDPSGNTWFRLDSHNDYTGRDDFYKTLDDLVKSPAYVALLKSSGLTLHAGAPDGTKAKDSLGALIALQTLSPFWFDGTGLEDALKIVWTDVFDKWSADKNLSTSERAEGKANFSDQYLTDRAKLLALVVERNERNVSGTYLPQNFAESAQGERYLDKTSNTDISTGIALNASLKPQIIFGKDKGDDANDVLAGGNLGDHLYGGGGDDELKGGKGKDWLEGNADVDKLDGGEDKDTLLGGEGNDSLDGGAGDDSVMGGEGEDTYTFKSGWGADVIVDSDGQGSLKVEGFDSGLPLGKKISDDLWRSEDKKVTYRRVHGLAGGKDLLIAFADRKDTITIRNWTSAKSLGISLEDPVLPTPTPTPTQIIATNDMVDWQGTYSTTDDLPDPDLDNEIIGAGVGRRLFGKAGNDRVFADQSITLNEAITKGEIQEASGVVGSYLDGGEGDDYMVGGAGNDLIVGGFRSLVAGATPARDTLIGGGGDDILLSSAAFNTYFPINWEQGGQKERPITGYSDGWYSAAGFTRDWTPKLIVNQYFDGVETFHFDVVPIVVSPSYSASKMIFDLVGNDTTAGDDSLFGGSGNDLMISGFGNDFLKGGSGADTIVAGVGADVLLGGSGKDYLLGDNGDFGAASGEDWMDGGDEDDVMWGQGSGDKLFGGKGADTLIGDGASIYVGDDYLNGEAGNDVLLGGGGADSILGADDDDRIIGDSRDALIAPVDTHGNDYLDGGDGKDSIWGGGKDDTLVGGKGNDLLFGDDESKKVSASAHGKDLMDGGEGNDQLVGGGEQDSLFGGDGNDTLMGDDKNDRLSADSHDDDLLDGEDGDDILAGGGGADTLFGGDGDDTLLGDADDDDTIDDQYQKADVLDGGGGDDQLKGSGGDDSLYGGEGDDALSGDDGDDYLEGGEGKDGLLGGDGKDTLVGDGKDHLEGGAGDDEYVLGLTDGWATYIKDTDGRNTIKGGTSSVKVFFGAGQIYVQLDSAMIALASEQELDSLYVSLSGTEMSLRQAIDASDGMLHSSVYVPGVGLVDTANVTTSQMLTGSHMSDQIGGGIANDQISGQVGNDSLSGNGGNDALWGDVGNDTLVGGEGNDQLYGGADSDQLFGGAGKDVLNGENGADLLHGEKGEDQLYGADGNDTVYGGENDDGLYGGYGDDDLSGDDGADYLGGNDGKDILLGGAGDDVLSGDEDNDTLDGGAGDDRLYGGDGADTYLFSRGGGHDTIGGGSPGDVLRFAADISDLDVAISRTGNSPNYSDLKISINGTDDFVVLESYFNNAGADTNSIVFGNNVSWNFEYVKSRIMSGSEGRDVILGSDLGDSLSSGGGDDEIYAGGGNDTIIGGVGNDRLAGEAGSDTYVFRPGDGYDLVENADNSSGHIDTIWFSGGVVAKDLRYSDSRGDLVITYDAGGNSVRIANFFQTTGYEAFNNHVQQIRFDSGATLTDVGVIGSSMGTANGDIAMGDGWENILDGQGGDDLLFGYNANDSLVGGAGNDTLIGGEGLDTMAGGLGDDFYYVNNSRVGDVGGGGAGNFYLPDVENPDELILEFAGEGNDSIITNTISMVVPENVENLKVYYNPTFSWWSYGDLDTSHYYVGNSSNNIIDTSEFIGSVSNISGNLWDVRDHSITLSGTDPADGSAGASGADTLIGGEANEIYRVFSAGDVVIEKGVRSDGSQISFDVVESYTHSYTIGSNIENLYLRSGDAVNGTGNSLDNYISGNQLANTLIGGSGNDTLEGNAGNDSLFGGTGNDVYLFSAAYPIGNDTISDVDATEGGLDELRLSGITTSDVGAGVERYT
ncbi:MAG: calcium-binding protein [Rhodocyclaceae bacterium]